MVSDKMEAMYISDRRLSEIIIFATIITVILTCLGQYGLSYFSAKKRIKEMAVRKVHGATPFIIMSLMNGEAIRLVLISTVLAVPVSFIILNKWLQKFAYRISFQSSAVLFSVVIILLITILVVFVHVYRLSRVNPAETIRYE
jgi:ABC-type antimicrobial peptide transport system permease subunit